MSSDSVLIARICHDLITPLNAINLGFEAFEASHDESLLPSIRESVSKSNTIMKFMRELFSDRSEKFCYSQFFLKQLTTDFLKFYNISFDLKSDMEHIASIAGKIVMYMAIVSKEIMPYGGGLSIRISDSVGEIITRCSGENISMPDMNIDKEINYKNVIRYNLLNLLKRSELRMLVYKDGEDIVFCKKVIDL